MTVQFVMISTRFAGESVIRSFPIFFWPCQAPLQANRKLPPRGWCGEARRCAAADDPAPEVRPESLSPSPPLSRWRPSPRANLNSESICTACARWAEALFNLVAPMKQASHSTLAPGGLAVWVVGWTRRPPSSRGGRKTAGGPASGRRERGCGGKARIISDYAPAPSLAAAAGGEGTQFRNWYRASTASWPMVGFLRLQNRKKCCRFIPALTSLYRASNIQDRMPTLPARQGDRMSSYEQTRVFLNHGGRVGGGGPGFWPDQSQKGPAEAVGDTRVF